jgi:chorismate mutase/prephenate dehydratase
MENHASLESLRGQIDALDARIVQLLNDRARIAKEIGELKRQTNTGVYHPDRESQIYRHVVSENKGLLPNASLVAIYREIMACSRALERPIKVAYLGPVGTFSYVAARRNFGPTVDYLSQRTIESVFREVAMKRTDFGIVPVENSSEGGIRETLQMFLEFDVKVCAEVVLPIHHSLLTSSPEGSIRKIYSKPQVFAQCKNWLANHFAEAELLEVGSTTEAARLAKKETDSAAIAHKEVAELYDLNVLYENIENSLTNVTRFFVLGENYPGPSGQDKTAIMCYIKNQVGALYGLLHPFKSYCINLTSIESLPSRRKAWDYSFYVELEGHASEPRVCKALNKVEKRCLELRILGSFPRSEPSPGGGLED